MNKEIRKECLIIANDIKSGEKVKLAKELCDWVTSRENEPMHLMYLRMSASYNPTAPDANVIIQEAVRLMEWIENDNYIADYDMLATLAYESN